ATSGARGAGLRVNLLVTGGLGFIGSNLVRLILSERPDWRVVNLDLVTYAANPANLADVEEGARYRFVRGDVADRRLVAELFLERLLPGPDRGTADRAQGHLGAAGPPASGLRRRPPARGLEPRRGRLPRRAACAGGVSRGRGPQPGRRGGAGEHRPRAAGARG